MSLDGLIKDCKFENTVPCICIIYSVICYFVWKLFATNLVEEKMGMCIFATVFYVLISMVVTAFAYLIVVVIQEEFKDLNKD